MIKDTDTQPKEGDELNADMRAINEQLLIAAIRQQELTAARKAENALQSVALYRLMARNFPNGMVLLFDHDLRHILADGRGLATLRLTKEALEGSTIWEGFTPELCSQMEPAYRAALAGETTVSEMSFPARGLEQADVERVYQVCALPVMDDGGTILSGMAVAQDVTDQRRAEETVRRQAYHDPLTGLPNRALLRDRLNQVIAISERSGKIAGLLFLDLDRFKQVNDAWGHAAGDHVLKVVAARLTACLRTEDTIARMGGDEFVVLLPSLHDVTDAAKVAGQIVTQVSAPIVIDGRRLSVLASVGISFFPFDGRDADSLLRHADNAMYHVKKSSGVHWSGGKPGQGGRTS